MAPTDTPWYEWEEIFPGSVERGPVPSKLVMFLPLTLFLAQAGYAVWKFRIGIQKQEVSPHYAIMIVLNIVAMSLVTGFTSLNGLLAGYFNEEKQFEMSTSALALYYTTIVLFSAIHSVNNCCRVIFDAYGLSAAMRFAPVAFLVQGWQVFALPLGFSPFTGVVILAAIDYLQHLIALTYWTVNICRKEESSRADPTKDKRRLGCGVGGVTFHMISIVPQMYYIVSIPFEDQTTTGICLVYATSIVLMFVSQCFWIAMALRTPPFNRKQSELGEYEVNEATEKDSDHNNRCDFEA